MAQLLVAIYSPEPETVVLEAQFNIQTYRLVPLGAFFAPVRAYLVNSPANSDVLPVLGDGLERGALCEAVAFATSQSQYYHPNGPYSTPVFLPTFHSSLQCLIHWKSFGALLALYWITTGVFPEPVSPWLCFAMLVGKDKLAKLSADMIAALDPESA